MRLLLTSHVVLRDCADRPTKLCISFFPKCPVSAHFVHVPKPYTEFGREQSAHFCSILTELDLSTRNSDLDHFLTNIII